MSDFVKIEEIINKVDKDFFDKMKLLGYYEVQDNDNELILEHDVNQDKIIICLRLEGKDKKLYVKFKNNNEDFICKDGWYLGTNDTIILDDIFNFINSEGYKLFVRKKIKTEEKYSQYDIDNYKSNINIQAQNDIKNICNKISEILVYKNKMYGNSILEPKNIFYKGNSITSILIRLDDKIGRVTNSEVIRVNDIVDIIGYLVLLLIAKRTQLTELENLKD